MYTLLERSLDIQCKNFRRRGWLLLRWPTLPGLQSGFYAHFVWVGSETIPHTEQTELRFCIMWAIALSVKWKECCQLRAWRGQWGVDQTLRVESRAPVRLQSLFGPQCFGSFQQQSLRNVGKLDRDFSVRSVYKRTTSIVTCRFVFRGAWDWSNMPFVPATIVISVESSVLKIANTAFMLARAPPTSSHSPYMPIAVPVQKRRHLSTIAGHHKKHRLTTETNPATAVVLE